jgi:hypothetical protein
MELVTFVKRIFQGQTEEDDSGVYDLDKPI